MLISRKSVLSLLKQWGRVSENENKEKEKKKKRLKLHLYTQSCHWTHYGQTQQAAAAVIHMVLAVLCFPAKLEM